MGFEVRPSFLHLSSCGILIVWLWAAPALSTLVATTVGQAPETSSLAPSVAPDLLVFPHSLPAPPPPICSPYLHWKVFTNPSCHIPVASQCSYDESVLLRGPARPGVVCPLLLCQPCFVPCQLLPVQPICALRRVFPPFAPHVPSIQHTYPWAPSSLWLSYILFFFFSFRPQLSHCLPREAFPWLPWLITFPFHLSHSTTTSPLCCFL